MFSCFLVCSCYSVAFLSLTVDSNLVSHPRQVRGVPLATGYHPHFARSLALTFDSSRPPGSRVIALHAFGRLIERPTTAASAASSSSSASTLPSSSASSVSDSQPQPQPQDQQDFYLIACTEFMAGGGDEIAAFRRARTLSTAAEHTRVAAVLIRYLRAKNAEAKAKAEATAEVVADLARNRGSSQNAADQDDDDGDSIVSASSASLASPPSSSAVSVLAGSGSGSASPANSGIEVGLGSRLNGAGDDHTSGRDGDADECLFEIDGRHPTHMVDVAAAF